MSVIVVIMVQNVPINIGIETLRSSWLRISIVIPIVIPMFLKLMGNGCLNTSVRETVPLEPFFIPPGKWKYFLFGVYILNIIVQKVLKFSPLFLTEF